MITVLELHNNNNFRIFLPLNLIINLIWWETKSFSQHSECLRGGQQVFDSCWGQGFISLPPFTGRFWDYPASYIWIPEGMGELFPRRENEWSFASISPICRRDVVLKGFLPVVCLTFLFPDIWNYTRLHTYIASIYNWRCWIFIMAVPHKQIQFLLRALFFFNWIRLKSVMRVDKYRLFSI
jgi:hypothetical protein